MSWYSVLVRKWREFKGRYGAAKDVVTFLYRNDFTRYDRNTLKIALSYTRPGYYL